MSELSPLLAKNTRDWILSLHIVSLLDVLEDSGTISVYPGWETFGKSDITKKVMRERMDDYAQTLLKRFNQQI